LDPEVSAPPVRVQARNLSSSSSKHYRYDAQVAGNPSLAWSPKRFTQQLETGDVGFLAWFASSDDRPVYLPIFFAPSTPGCRVSYEFVLVAQGSVAEVRAVDFAVKGPSSWKKHIDIFSPDGLVRVPLAFSAPRGEYNVDIVVNESSEFGFFVKVLHEVDSATAGQLVSASTARSPVPTATHSGKRSRGSLDQRHRALRRGGPEPGKR
jgi:hypothetical protein